MLVDVQHISSFAVGLKQKSLEEDLKEVKDLIKLCIYTSVGH